MNNEERDGLSRHQFVGFTAETLPKFLATASKNMSNYTAGALPHE